MDVQKHNDYFKDSKFVQELTPDDFDKKEVWKLKNERCCIVLFYADWCPHCKAVKDVWEKLAEVAAFFDVCAFNCAHYNDHVQLIKEEMSSLIEGYPTFIIYEKGEPIESTGHSARDVKTFTEACMRSCKSTPSEI